MEIKTIRRQAGFTLVEIMIVVAIIGLLAAIAIPNFMKSRATSQAQACISNMQQIDGATTQWALETHHTQGDTPPTVVQLQNLGYLHTPGGSAPSCPALGNYTIATIGTTPSVTCSLSSTVTPAHALQ
jgi:prepilin-type N-terminal cleavage/methylation domain-containing protein